MIVPLPTIASFTNNGLVQTVHVRPRLVHRRSGTAATNATAGVLGWDACSPRPWTRRSALLADDICSLLRKGALGI